MKRHDPLVGEHLALDLVNTRPVGTDLLDSTQALQDWLTRQAERAPELAEYTETSDTALAAVSTIRDRVDEAVTELLAGQSIPLDVVAVLNDALRAAPTYSRLSIEGDAVVVRKQRSGTDDERLAAILAEAAANLLTDPEIGRLKECEADDCRLVFLQTHPRRRWCSPDRCGNRVRVARYYRQNKKGS